MTIKRLDPANLAADPSVDVDAFIESDYRIRSGQCPNQCGRLTPTEFGQECLTCKFETNVTPDREEMS